MAGAPASCFRNDDSSTNGEEKFFSSIRANCKVIFDVGSRYDSIFQECKDADVHYFDPVSPFLEKLKLVAKNKIAHFNPFGLSDEDAVLDYYPHVQSFLRREVTVHAPANVEHSVLEVRRGDKYMADSKIDVVDFMKIDTEGYELKVVKGFGDELQKVRVLQFEYGGTYIDCNIKLQDVITYLATQGFARFAYVSPDGLFALPDVVVDHYTYCNIVCFNQKFDQPAMV